MTTTATESPSDRLAARAASQAEGLRHLADMIESHPALVGTSAYMQGLPVWWALDAKELRDIARAALAHGAEVNKRVSGDCFILELGWQGISALAYSERSRVCERVVTGVETVVETIPDPELVAQLPTVRVEREVEQVEWHCGPLMDDPEETVA